MAGKCRGGVRVSGPGPSRSCEKRVAPILLVAVDRDLVGPGLDVGAGRGLAGPRPAVRAGLDGAVRPDRADERRCPGRWRQSTVAERRKRDRRPGWSAWPADRTSDRSSARPRSSGRRRTVRSTTVRLPARSTTVDAERVAARRDDDARPPFGPSRTVFQVVFLVNDQARTVLPAELRRRTDAGQPPRWPSTTRAAVSWWPSPSGEK